HFARTLHITPSHCMSEKNLLLQSVQNLACASFSSIRLPTSRPSSSSFCRYSRLAATLFRIAFIALQSASLSGQRLFGSLLRKVFLRRNDPVEQASRVQNDDVKGERVGRVQHDSGRQSRISRERRPLTGCPGNDGAPAYGCRAGRLPN